MKNEYLYQDLILRKLSIIDEDGGKAIRMAHLATIGAHHINGVAALHSDLIKRQLLPEFAELWPEKFTNVTNGVTPRRWVALANPELSKPNSSDDETQSSDIVEQLRLAKYFLTHNSVNITNKGYIITSDDLAKAIWLFPIVGVAIGGLGALTLILLIWTGVPEPVAAALSVGLIIWITGATQEDGLANLIDGLGSGKNQEQKIAIRINGITIQG